ncbi:hypothetical protein ABK040_002123 [Willaertia magna]
MSPLKFILASIFTFVVCFVVLSVFMDGNIQPSHCEIKVLKIDDANSPFPTIDGVMDSPIYNGTPPYNCPRSETQSKLSMFLISFFVGGLAVDRFIMGYTCIGVAKLLVPTCGIWQLVDWILILTGGLYMSNGCALYNDM